MKADLKFCGCWRKDPICTRCGKPQRLHNNWFYDPLRYDGAPKWTKRQHITKKQDASLRKFVEHFMKIPIDEIINPDKIRKELAKISRKQLRANGFNTKGLTGEDCISLSTQHTRAFLGMDAPNVFTGVK